MWDQKPSDALALVRASHKVWDMPGMEQVQWAPQATMAQPMQVGQRHMERHSVYAPTYKVHQCLDHLGNACVPIGNMPDEDTDGLFVKKSRIKVLDKAHLQQLIAWYMQHEGVGCDLNHLDVSAISDFDLLFAQSMFNGRIDRWDMRAAVTARKMFYLSAFCGDVSAWRLPKVVDMDQMFYGSVCQSNVDGWGVSKSAQMARAFEKSSMPLPHWYSGK